LQYIYFSRYLLSFFSNEWRIYLLLKLFTRCVTQLSFLTLIAQEIRLIPVLSLFYFSAGR